MDNLKIYYLALNLGFCALFQGIEENIIDIFGILGIQRVCGDIPRCTQHCKQSVGQSWYL